ncbi:hypothetical protein MT355_04245 [Rathayibacter sp. VKM Ac-2929]|uniref:hypothetical protein n=1 Tax=Rathayibacter sp. VKM Ac-2929 TaxID=2929480 RepID=UPI001FB4B853|nr:hypothetical protein [Rathayibacter sp. VKM Ac-2929]MCJ1672457.1 hypothetical protein [Rathayibacter sp. VKM Ac-2929]
MSTSSDGAPRRPRTTASRVAGAAPARRAAPAPRTLTRTASSSAAAPGGRFATLRRRYGAATASILLAIVVVPIAFFVWYAIISLGAYPGDQAVSDLLVGVLYTAIIHALLLAGVLLGVSSIRARRREGRPAIAGWIGVVLNVLVVVFWELLVSPWLVELWNRAVGA